MSLARMKLGRLAPTPAQRLRALPLRKYLTAPLPPAPASCNNSNGAPIAMWGNDQYGDCTFAALANYRAICSAKEGTPFPTRTDDVVKAYLAFTHGHDVGAMEHDVLNLAMTGVKLGGQEPWRLAAWVTVNLADVETCKSLIAIFWGLYLGVSLPISAQSQTTWDAAGNMSGDGYPGSWGGHALLWSDYDENGAGLVTWGQVQPATYRWVSAYGDEAYVLLDQDRALMAGVDWDSLTNDIRIVAQRAAGG